MSYKAVIFTPTEVDRLANAAERAPQGKGIEFRTQVLPLLWAEMQVVYYGRHVGLTGTEADEAVLRASLAEAWQAGTFEQAIAALAQHYGEFDPERAFFGDAAQRFESSSAYQDYVLAHLIDDLVETEKGQAGSPRKAAAELFRDLRDGLRACVDFGRLSESSHCEFFGCLSSQINRMIVGPPAQRGYELRALVDAGVVSMPYGPAPQARFESRAKRWEVASTHLGQHLTQTVDHLVMGYLPPPSVNRSESTFLQNLSSAGRIRTFARQIGNTAGIDVTADHHPIGRSGEVQSRLFVLGPLVEGVRYFNRYIPSPGSRSRAFRDAEACMREIFARQPQAVDQ